MSDKFVGKKLKQPKKEIMTFLAGKGVRVPRVFDTLDDTIRAASNNAQISLRSEHWQDYEGSSDLFPDASLDILMRREKLDNITQGIIKKNLGKIKYVRLHCCLLGIDFDEFIKGLSYSAWEYISGANRMIVADSAIRHRYHVISLDTDSYCIFENDKIRSLATGRRYFTSVQETRGLVDLYEQIRDLLQKDHCYIIETQSRANYHTRLYEHFAVQVHRGVDFKEAGFTIECFPGPGYKGLRLVRGATSENGEEMFLTLRYPEAFKDQPRIIDEDASIEADYREVPKVFSEIMFRRRKLHLLPDFKSLRFYEKLRHHVSRSALFKPKNSAIILWGLPEYFGSSAVKRKNGFEQIRIHYISDGTNGYIRFLEN